MSAPAIMECPTCKADVPAGAFCGRCGAHLTPQQGDGPAWLRFGVYCAESDEHVLRPSIASSLFPQLSQLARNPFRLGFILLLGAVAAAVPLKLPAALITVAALGVPLLFVIYLFQSKIYRDASRRALVLSALLGIGIGVAWVLWSDDLIARDSGAAFDAGIAGHRVLRDGLGVPEGGLLLMLLPPFLVRLLPVPRRESLSGFAIGALGALCFTAATTLTKMAPQYATASVAAGRPVPGLFFEAAIRGVTVPLTAACAGGLIGVALWFTGPAGKPRFQAWLVRVALLVLGAAVVGTCATVGLVDLTGVTQVVMLTCYVGMTVVALIALRIGLQLALLHEARDAGNGEPALCPRCRHVVPAMAFCPACGAATNALSRLTRAERQELRPLALSHEGDEKIWPGYSVPAGTYEVDPMHWVSSWRVLGIWSVVIALVAAPLIALPEFGFTPSARYNCPPDCGRPPTGKPVARNPRYTSPSGDFSVSYPAPGTAYDVKLTGNGVTARYTGGDGGQLELFSQPANGRTPKEILKSVLESNFPDARADYEIPNAMVGYQVGYGQVADSWQQGQDATYRHIRIVLVVAVKNDLALIAGGIGPFHEFSPTFGPGRPSGANVEIAQDMGKYVNSFAWKGDRPR